MTGDGVADLGVGAAPGGGPRARLFDGRTGDLLSDRFYGPDAARGGASVALSADGVFVGSGGGRAASVGLYDVRTGNLIREFLPFPGYDGPVNVATGDLDGDGRAELIATPGAGGGPVVAAFDARTGAAVGTFLAGPAGDRGGLSVTSADVDGDGKAEVVVGELAGRAARVYRAGGPCWPPSRGSTTRTTRAACRSGPAT